MRNPADLRDDWPELWSGMEPIADVLWGCLKENPDLRDLPNAFGKSPSRKPPSDRILNLFEQLSGSCWG